MQRSGRIAQLVERRHHMAPPILGRDTAGREHPLPATDSAVDPSTKTPEPGTAIKGAFNNACTHSLCI